MKLSELLLEDGGMLVNRKLVQTIGLEAAVLYTDLLEKHQHFAKQGLLQDGWFAITIDDLQRDTTLTRSQQKKVISKLLKWGLIEYKVKGLPARRWFKLILDSTLLSAMEADEYTGQAMQPQYYN